MEISECGHHGNPAPTQMGPVLAPASAELGYVTAQLLSVEAGSVTGPAWRLPIAPGTSQNCKTQADLQW